MIAEGGRLCPRASAPAGRRPSIELEVADCDNRVRIYFDLEDADDRLNSFHKIDALINSLVAFRDAMAEEAALRRRRLRRRRGANPSRSSRRLPSCRAKLRPSSPFGREVCAAWRPGVNRPPKDCGLTNLPFRDF